MFRKITIFLLAFFISSINFIHAQYYVQDSIIGVLKQHVNVLAHDSLYGRGYVNGGLLKAESYIIESFKEMGIQPYQEKFQQTFTHSINTFPNEIVLYLDDLKLQTGKEYLLHPGSLGIDLKHQKIDVIQIDSLEQLNNYKDQIVFVDRWEMVKEVREGKRINWNSLIQPPRFIAYKEPKKGIWWPSKDTLSFTVLSLIDSQLNILPSEISLQVDQIWIDSFTSSNIVGYLPATDHSDSFVLICAHYDHIGSLGHAVFNGASDNASGTAMVLYLAQYFKLHPTSSNLMFCLFAGEECGLLGSKQFVTEHANLLPKVKFVLNLDIVGNATNGFTVVNGENHPRFSEKLLAAHEQLVERKSIKRFENIHIRENTNNSDHYPFTTFAVPAFFVFSNGGQGYYHDIYDTASNLELSNIGDLAILLTEFLSSL